MLTLTVADPELLVVTFVAWSTVATPSAFLLSPTSKNLVPSLSTIERLLKARCILAFASSPITVVGPNDARTVEDGSKTLKLPGNI